MRNCIFTVEASSRGWFVQREGARVSVPVREKDRAEHVKERLFDVSAYGSK